jgi:hypothetical protein
MEDVDDNSSVNSDESVATRTQNDDFRRETEPVQNSVDFHADSSGTDAAFALDPYK